MLLALGMPTIISPIPSYMRIAQPGRNCLLARNTDEYAQAIETYLDEHLRERIGKAGRLTVLEQYSPEVLGLEWVKVIERTCQAPRAELVSGRLTRLMSRIVQFSASI